MVKVIPKDVARFIENIFRGTKNVVPNYLVHV